jgi:hypothetical protein
MLERNDGPIYTVIISKCTLGKISSINSQSDHLLRDCLDPGLEK